MFPQPQPQQHPHVHPSIPVNSELSCLALFSLRKSCLGPLFTFHSRPASLQIVYTVGSLMTQARDS